MAHTTLEFARSQLEYMHEELAKSIGTSGDHPYTVKYLKACTTRAELSKFGPGVKVVLATSPSLEAGSSRELFVEWAQDPRNAILFPTEPEDGSLADQVIKSAAVRDGNTHMPPPVFPVSLSRRVPLEGEELETYLTQQEEERRLAARVEAERAQRMDVDGGSPRSLAHSDLGGAGGAGPQVTRASSSAIGHLKSGAAGRTVIVGADGLPLAEDGSQPVEDCLIEGFEVPAGAVAPMFPAEDEWESVVYDAYGAALDETDLDPEAANRQSLQDQLEAEQAAAAGTEGDLNSAEDGGSGDVLDVPTKVVEESSSVELRCGVLTVDLNGLSDAGSVKRFLAGIAPRACVIIRGNSEDTSAIKTHLEDQLQGLHAAVYVPQAGETIEIEESASYSIRLGETVGTAEGMHSVTALGVEYEMSWLDGVVAEGEEDGGLPILMPASKKEQPGQLGIFIGDVKLTRLKAKLYEAGIASEFHGGDLYCDCKVIIKRRPEGGGLTLEGALSEDYYRVRELVYAQYHIA